MKSFPCAACVIIGSLPTHSIKRCHDITWANEVHRSALKEVLAERWIACCASYGSCRLCAGFIHSHVSLALKKRGDGIIGLDNFNNYYPVALKRARAENPKLVGM